MRLVYVSRDFLHSDVVTNDLVNDNEGCMDLVKHAMKLIDFQDHRHHTVMPRKSLLKPLLFCSSVLAVLASIKYANSKLLSSQG